MCQTDGTPKQIEYLRDALKKGIENREINHIHRLIKRARFPVYKTFDGYDFCQTKLPPALTKEDKCLFHRKEAEPGSLWTSGAWEDTHGNRHRRTSLQKKL